MWRGIFTVKWTPSCKTTSKTRWTSMHEILMNSFHVYCFRKMLQSVQQNGTCSTLDSFDSLLKLPPSTTEWMNIFLVDVWKVIEFESQKVERYAESWIVCKSEKEWRHREIPRTGEHHQEAAPNNNTTTAELTGDVGKAEIFIHGTSVRVWLSSLVLFKTIKKIQNWHGFSSIFQWIWQTLDYYYSTYPQIRFYHQLIVIPMNNWR